MARKKGIIQNLHLIIRQVRGDHCVLPHIVSIDKASLHVANTDQNGGLDAESQGHPKGEYQAKRYKDLF